MYRIFIVAPIFGSSGMVAPLSVLMMTMGRLEDEMYCADRVVRAKSMEMVRRVFFIT